MSFLLRSIRLLLFAIALLLLLIRDATSPVRPAIVRSPVISTAASSVRSPEVVLMVSVVSL